MISAEGIWYELSVKPQYCSLQLQTPDTTYSPSNLAEKQTTIYMHVYRSITLWRGVKPSALLSLGFDPALRTFSAASKAEGDLRWRSGQCDHEPTYLRACHFWKQHLVTRSSGQSWHELMVDHCARLVGLHEWTPGTSWAASGGASWPAWAAQRYSAAPASAVQRPALRVMPW